MRSSLFHLAFELDVSRGAVLVDWTRRGGQEIKVALPQLEVMNLFMRRRSLAEAGATSGMSEAELAPRVEALVGAGLVLEDATWQQLRERRPYTNLPSLQVPETLGRFASYEEAYRHEAVPWNALPIAADLLALAPLAGQSGRRLLDVGCGSGLNLGLMQALGYETWGLDISPTAIERARRIARAPDRLVVGSAATLPWPDASFDLVTDIGCLHCLDAEARPRYVAEIRRVLAPMGRFVCRAFKPRGPALLAAQPVAMSRLGFDPPEVVSMFGGALAIEAVKEGPVHVYYEGVHIARGA